MSEPTDLDIREYARQQEIQLQIAALCNRGAALASELASTQARLKAAEEKLKNGTTPDAE